MSNSRRDFIKLCGPVLACLLSYSKSEAHEGLFDGELPDLLTGENGERVKSVNDWLAKREKIRALWSSYLGITGGERGAVSVKILSEELTGGIIRQYIEYTNEPGSSVNAYLLKPQKAGSPVPGVVAFHSTSDYEMKYIAGIEKGKIPPGAYDLAKLGFTVICPQCFLWRDKGARSWEEQAERYMAGHKGSKAMAGMLYDAMRAVDVLLSVAGTDPDRIGAMGHSLGGKEVLYLTAFDERVKAVVSNEGGIGINFSNWNDSWYLGRDISSFGHQHHEILALCAPRPFLLIGGNSSDGEKSRDYIEAVKPVYRLYGKEENLGFFNHGKGHDIVPESDKASFDWLLRHLKSC